MVRIFPSCLARLDWLGRAAELREGSLAKCLASLTRGEHLSCSKATIGMCKYY